MQGKLLCLLQELANIGQIQRGRAVSVHEHDITVKHAEGDALDDAGIELQQPSIQVAGIAARHGGDRGGYSEKALLAIDDETYVDLDAVTAIDSPRRHVVVGFGPALIGRMAERNQRVLDCANA